MKELNLCPLDSPNLNQQCLHLSRRRYFVNNSFLVGCALLESKRKYYLLVRNEKGIILEVFLYIK